MMDEARRRRGGPEPPETERRPAQGEEKGVAMFRQTLAVVALLSLSAAGRAAGAIDLFEEKVKDFGTVPRGPTLVHYFRLTNNTDQPLVIGNVRVSCGCVTASAASAQVPPGKTTAITAQMDTRRFTGSKTVTIYVQFTHPRFEEVALQVTAFSRDDFAIYPDTIAFGQVRRGKAAQASVQVSLTGDPEWRVTEATADSNYVRPVVRELRRNGAEVVYEVTAKLRPDVPVGKWFTDVWVRTTNPGLGRLRIPLMVEVEPALAVSPSPVQFTEVKVGGKVEQKIMVKGNKPFRVTGVKGIDKQWRVEATTDEARPVQVLNIVFRPQEAGTIDRTITLITDLTGENEIPLPVRAKVIDPEGGARALPSADEETPVGP